LKPVVRTALKAEGWQIVDGPVSLEQLARQLPGQHILHLVGHGYTQPDRDSGPAQTALYLEKDEGTLQIVKAADLVARLAAIGQLPHLVFLMACESAAPQTPTAHPFIGLGPQLVQAGVPAVVAMQAQVPIAMSRPFTSEFYRRLVEHGEVDKAMSQARLVVFRPDRVDWAVPVLFMRLRDGRLFTQTTENPDSAKPKEADMSGEKSNRSGGVNITSRGNVVVGGEVVQGDKISNNTGTVKKETGRSGGVDLSVGSGAVIMGDVVGRDKITSTVTNTTGVDGLQLVALLKQFAAIKRQIETRPEDPNVDKDELKAEVKKIEEEVKKGETANVAKLERWLMTLGSMADDIFQVTVASLTSPLLGIAKSVQLVAQKAKEEKAKLDAKK
jgi:hypothetical protein